MNKTLSTVFWRGLATVAPVAITVAIIYWVGVSLEAVLGGLLQVFVPARYYVPGTGLVVAVVLIMAVGVVMHAWVVRKLIELGESLIGRIPFAKTIYGGMRDIMRYLGMMAEKRDLGKVVLVDLGKGKSVLGFLTSEDLPFAGEDDDPSVAVFLPMSYQLGGYTLCIPASRIRRVDFPSEEAMRWVLTAGISRDDRAEESR